MGRRSHPSHLRDAPRNARRSARSAALYQCRAQLCRPSSSPPRRETRSSCARSFPRPAPRRGTSASGRYRRPCSRTRTSEDRAARKRRRGLRRTSQPRWITLASCRPGWTEVVGPFRLNDSFLNALHYFADGAVSWMLANASKLVPFNVDDAWHSNIQRIADGRRARGCEVEAVDRGRVDRRASA
ncbi:hypothetical protein DFJ74DRAFT_680864 [Hyaloraphidium curvatum]|nr:hypothetical protein DFJ74DRAFT_680864 [Hyaloraphidium curvatum]